MAGYFLYTLDGDAFTALVTEPTDEQARALAAQLVDESRGGLLDVGWPTDVSELTGFVKERLAADDWYGDLSQDAAALWTNVVFSLREEPGEACGLDFQCSDYESIYWDCAEFAAEHGAPMMSAPTFGSSGFRCPPDRLDPDGDDPLDPYYSLYTPAQTRTLHDQLRAVEPHAAALPDREEEGSVAEQFFEGLLPTVAAAAESGRVLFVQLDT